MVSVDGPFGVGNGENRSVGVFESETESVSMGTGNDFAFEPTCTLSVINFGKIGACPHADATLQFNPRRIIMFWITGAKYWKESEFTIFWILIAGVILLIVWISIPPETFTPKNMPREIRDAASVATIDRLMNEFVSQGYKVEQTQHLVTNPEMREQALITYEVTSPDGKEKRVYTWGWQGPYAIMTRPSRDRYGYYIQKMKLKPKTEAALEIQAKFNEYLVEDGFSIYVWE